MYFIVQERICAYFQTPLKESKIHARGKVCCIIFSHAKEIHNLHILEALELQQDLQYHMTLSLVFHKMLHNFS